MLVQRAGSPCTRRLGLRPLATANHGAEVRFFAVHHFCQGGIPALLTRSEGIWCGRLTADRLRVDSRPLPPAVVAVFGAAGTQASAKVGTLSRAVGVRLGGREREGSACDCPPLVLNLVPSCLKSVVVVGGALLLLPCFPPNRHSFSLRTSFIPPHALWKCIRIFPALVM
jgi:hypothetical protein